MPLHLALWGTGDQSYPGLIMLDKHNHRTFEEMLVFLFLKANILPILTDVHVLLLSSPKYQLPLRYMCGASLAHPLLPPQLCEWMLLLGPLVKMCLNSEW